MKLIFAGDYCPESEVKWEPQIETLIRNSDYSFINYESPIVTDNDIKIPKYGPNLQTNEKALLPLKQLGFSCVTLANNHTLDYGPKALLYTIDCIEKEDINYVGAGKNLEFAQKPLIKELGEKKIGVINCCEHEFSIANIVTPGTNPLDPINQYYQIKNLRQIVDFIIIIIHGGHEGFQLPSPRMQDSYRFLIDAGANVVINHHQHCYSGYEKYHDGLIFYGLGNFFFPDDNLSKNKMWNEGYLLELEVQDKNLTYKIHPYIQCRNDRKIRLMNSIEKKLFHSNFEYLNDKIINRSSLVEENEKWRIKTQNSYRIALLPYFNRFFKGLWIRQLIPSGISKAKLSRLINFIECESHRDRFLDYLKRIYGQMNS